VARKSQCFTRGFFVDRTWAKVWKVWTDGGVLKSGLFLGDYRLNAKDCGERAEKAEEEAKAWSGARLGMMRGEGEISGAKAPFFLWKLFVGLKPHASTQV
jgi:hypothetical protein